MKVLQIGLGVFGSSWLRDVLLPHDRVDTVAVVDLDPDRLAVAADAGVHPDRCYERLDDALAAGRPDLVLVTTPPAAHEDPVLTCLARGIPVLCEKPLAPDLGTAERMLDAAHRTGTPLLVAENYRYRPLFGRLRAVLAETPGPVVAIDVELARRHGLDNYHGALDHPLLLDVAPHHLDVVRYLTGDEPSTLTARSWRRSGSSYTGHHDAVVHGRMSSGTAVTFRGSLDTLGEETAWSGRWRVSTPDADVLAHGDAVEVRSATGRRTWHVDGADDGRRSLLDDVLLHLATGRAAACDATDNVRSLRFALSALRAADAAAVEHDAVGHDAPGHVGHDAPGHVEHHAPGQVGHNAPGHVEHDAPGHVRHDAAGQVGRRATRLREAHDVGTRDEPPGAPRRVTWETPHAALDGCHGGWGTVQHTQLLGADDFATTLRFVNHTVLPPGTSIGTHRHGDDEELYVVLAGTGVMTVDGRTFRVGPGDVVVNQPRGTHGLVNDSTGDLELLVMEVGL